METTIARLSPADALRTEFETFAETLGMDAEMRSACRDFLMEKTRQAWINGKEFGWKKAWNWKRGERSGSSRA